MLGGKKRLVPNSITVLNFEQEEELKLHVDQLGITWGDLKIYQFPVSTPNT